MIQFLGERVRLLLQNLIPYEYKDGNNIFQYNWNSTEFENI